MTDWMKVDDAQVVTAVADGFARQAAMLLDAGASQRDLVTAHFREIGRLITTTGGTQMEFSNCLQSFANRAREAAYGDSDV